MAIKAKRLFDRWQKDPEYRKEYEALAPEFERAKTLVAARTKAGLTQAEVAKRMGTTQPVVARLEAGRQRPSLATLERYANAVGCELRISLTKKKGATG